MRARERNGSELWRCDVRLKERFEHSRSEYNRHLREHEEELMRAEKELEEHKKRLQEAEEKQKQDVEEKRSSLQQIGFNYSLDFYEVSVASSLSHSVHVSSHFRGVTMSLH